MAVHLTTEAGAQEDAREGCVDLSAPELALRAAAAAALLKTLAHEGRLMILCHLAGGEKSVTALEDLLQSRQAAVSQQLARLRIEGLVESRRDGKAIYYSLRDPKAAVLLTTVHRLFCSPDSPV